MLLIMFRVCMLDPLLPIDDINQHPESKETAYNYEPYHDYHPFLLPQYVQWLLIEWIILFSDLT
jgi:hypothetical protein